MPKPINLITTLKGSLLENFYPSGWDLKKIDRCCDMSLKTLTTPAKFWNEDFLPRPVADVSEMDRRIGDETANPVTVYGSARVSHIAFWEPQLAGQYSPDNWKKQTHKIGVALHPLTIEQNAITSFNSRFTLVPAFANTIGPGLFLQSDWCIGGCDGAYPDRGAQFQGASLCVTLQYGPDTWVPSSWMPTMPGRLFFLRQL